MLLLLEALKWLIYGSKRKKEVYDACTNYLALVSKEDAEYFKQLKEKLEYCVFYLVGRDETKEESALRQLEDQFGKYAYEICLRYLPEDVDPIEDLEIRNAAKVMGGLEESEEKGLKSIVAGMIFLLSLPGIAIILIWLAFAFDMFSTDIGVLLDIRNYIPFFIGLIWMWVVSLVWKGNKLRIERRKRVVGKEKNVKIHNQTSIIRLVLRLFGL